MAYILDKKIVKDTEEFSNHAYGITLPVMKGNSGYFNQAFSSFEQAKSNLKNLLLTNKGERILQPNFGTGLQGLLFEQMTDNLEERLESVITCVDELRASARVHTPPLLLQYTFSRVISRKFIINLVRHCIYYLARAR